MHIKKQQLLFIGTTILIILTLIYIGNAEPIGRFSLGILFTVLLWHRTDRNISRWMALFILWLGIAIAIAWTWISQQ